MADTDGKQHFAPHLCAYLENKVDFKYLQISGSKWNKIKPDQETEMLIDISGTPMAGVTKQAGYIAATAKIISPSEVQIQIFRSDPKDPKPYNMDTYLLLDDLSSRPDFLDIVDAASTDNDENMHEFLNEYKFIVPQKPGDFHWLDEDELPQIVRCKIQPNSADI